LKSKIKDKKLQLLARKNVTIQVSPFAKGGDEYLNSYEKNNEWYKEITDSKIVNRC